MRLRAWLRAQYIWHVRKLQPCEDCATLIPRRRADQRDYYPRCEPCLESFMRRVEMSSGMPATLDPAALPQWRWL